MQRDRGTTTERGYGADWRKFRAWFLRQDENALCAFRNDPRHRDECTLGSTVVDHITPLPEGERLDPSNCRGVCRAAHDALTLNLKLTGRNELPKESR